MDQVVLHAQRGTGNAPFKNSRLDVSKVRSQPVPEGAVPSGLFRLRRVGARITLRLIGVDPYGIDGSFQQRLEGAVVLTIGGDELVPRKGLAGAPVRHDGEVVGGGCPSHHVRHFHAAEVAVPVDHRYAVLETGQYSRGLVVRHDGRTEFHVPISNAGSMGVRHTSVVASGFEAFADHVAAPAIFDPIGLGNFELKCGAYFDEAEGEVWAEAGEGRIVFDRSQLGEGGIVDCGCVCGKVRESGKVLRD
eukprot:scaffold147166_cov44-Attheya_sp.AAC.3